MMSLQIALYCSNYINVVRNEAGCGRTLMSLVKVSRDRFVFVLISTRPRAAIDDIAEQRHFASPTLPGELTFSPKTICACTAQPNHIHLLTGFCANQPLFHLRTHHIDHPASSILLGLFRIRRLPHVSSHCLQRDQASR